MLQLYNPSRQLCAQHNTYTMNRLNAIRSYKQQPIHVRMAS
jgi:hypothetical protein